MITPVGSNEYEPAWNIIPRDELEKHVRDARYIKQSFFRISVGLKGKSYDFHVFSIGQCAVARLLGMCAVKAAELIKHKIKLFFLIKCRNWVSYARVFGTIYFSTLISDF